MDTFVQEQGSSTFTRGSRNPGDPLRPAVRPIAFVISKILQEVVLSARALHASDPTPSTSLREWGRKRSAWRRCGR